jgi:hypothetical protein
MHVGWNEISNNYIKDVVEGQNDKGNFSCIFSIIKQMSGMVSLRNI